MPIPKPVLTFVVGVTGHRSARLKDEHLSRIAQQLADVCGNIEAECQAQLDRNLDLYAEPQPRLQLISSLADGADAMAVEQCPGTWTVAGILPLPEGDYVSFLRSTALPAHADQAIAEFTAARRRAARVATLPPLPAQGASELARSRDFLLRQIDVLVAVWDGSPPDLPGGTADVVDCAAEAGIPIIWVAADRVQKAWAISSIDDANRESQMADATSGPIADIVRRELGVSRRHVPLREPWDVVSHDADPGQRLGEFLKEDFLAGSEGVTRAWVPFLAALPAQDEFSKRVQDILLPRFVAADALATHYGRRYRMAYICAYLLSACAVAAALASFLLFGGKYHERVPIQEVCLATVEFFLVALIVAIVWHGRRKRWHDRWLDYRALAETLRHLRFLGPLGQYEKRAYLESAARPGCSGISGRQCVNSGCRPAISVPTINVGF